MENTKTVEKSFINRMAGNVVLSDAERALFTQLISEDPSVFTLIPPTVPAAENIVFLACLAFAYKYDAERDCHDFTQAACNILITEITTNRIVLAIEKRLRSCNVDGLLTASEEAVVQYLYANVAIS